MRCNCYWLLKFSEKHIGAKEETIVLNKLRDKYIILVTNYFVECKLRSASHWDLKPQDLVRVTITHGNARRDALSIWGKTNTASLLCLAMKESDA